MKFNIKKPVYVLAVASLCLLGGGLQATVNEPLTKSECKDQCKACNGCLPPPWGNGCGTACVNCNQCNYELCNDQCTSWYGGEEFKFMLTRYCEKASLNLRLFECYGNKDFKAQCSILHIFQKKKPISEEDKRKNCDRYCKSRYNDDEDDEYPVNFDHEDFMHYRYDLHSDSKKCPFLQAEPSA